MRAVRSGRPSPSWWARPRTETRPSPWRRKNQPGLVLMDINMPEMNGIEATRTDGVPDPDVVVILCSTYDALGDLPPRWPQRHRPTSTREPRRGHSAGCGRRATCRSSCRSDPSGPQTSGTEPRTCDSSPTSESQVHGATDGAQPVRHVDVPMAPLGRLRVEPRSVVGDGEEQSTGLLPQLDLDV